jgi:hypothetical protein
MYDRGTILTTIKERLVQMDGPVGWIRIEDEPIIRRGWRKMIGGPCIIMEFGEPGGYPHAVNQISFQHKQE